MSAEVNQRDEIARLGPWFHNLHLPDGSETAPDHWLGDFPRFKWETLARYLPDDMNGMQVLDVGCNAGFYSVEMAKRGATVLAVDTDARYLRQAAWVIEQFGFGNQITLKQMEVYELARDPRQYDLVLFLGVFYHLRYPLLGLDIVARRTQSRLVFQSLMLPGEEVIESKPEDDINAREAMLEAGWPKMAFVEESFAKDPSNWWVPNRAGVEAMLRSCGLEVQARPEPEMFICAQTGRHPVRERLGHDKEYESLFGR